MTFQCDDAHEGDVTAIPDLVDLEAGISAIGCEWIEWSKRTGIDAPTFTEALRFFGYLVVERPELLEFNSDEKTKWQVVLGYLNTQRA